MRLVVLGLSLLYLGSEEAADVPADILKTLSNENFRKFALMTLKSCAYAGTGNVLKVQDMLHACAEHIDDADACAHQMAAVVGIALVAMGEEVGKIWLCVRWNISCNTARSPFAAPCRLRWVFSSCPIRTTPLPTF